MNPLQNPLITSKYVEELIISTPILTPTPPPSSTVLEPPVWLAHSPTDQLLAALYEAGEINGEWELKDPAELASLEYNEPEFAEFLDREKPLLQFLLNASTIKGGELAYFSIIGSYVRKIVGHPQWVKALGNRFPNTASLLDKIAIKLEPYNDIDLRMMGVEKKAVSDFRANLISLTSVPFEDHSPPFTPDLDVESIKIGPLDIVYCRHDGHSSVRAVHQGLTIGLLPFLTRDVPLELNASVQTILNLLCRIGHWNKKNNDKWDYCFYIFMISCGFRFPNPAAEIELKTIFLKENLGEQEKAVTTFNKVEKISQNALTIYCLNHCALVPELTGPLLAKCHPTSPFLTTILELQKKCSYATLTALLQILSIRILLNTKSNSDHLPFGLDVVMHKKAPHLQFQVDSMNWLIPLNLKEAWSTVIHEEVLEELLPLIKLCAPINHFEDIHKTAFFQNYPKISSFIDIPWNELVPHLASRDLTLKRLAWITFLGQFHLCGNQTAFFDALEYGDKKLLQSYNLSACYQRVLSDFIGSDALQTFFNGDFWDLSKLAEKFVYSSDESLFFKSLEWLRPSAKIFDALNHHLKYKRIDKILALLQKLSRIVTEEQMEDSLCEVSRLLLAREITVDNLERFKKIAPLFADILMAAIKKYPNCSTWNVEYKKIADLFLKLGLKDAAKELNSSIDEWQKQIDLALIRQLKEKPDLIQALDVLNVAGEYPEDVRKALLDFVKQLDRNLKTFLLIFSDVRFRSLFDNPEDKLALTKILEELIQGKRLDSGEIIKMFELDLPYSNNTKMSLLLKICKEEQDPLKSKAKALLLNFAPEFQSKIRLSLFKLDLRELPFDQIQIPCAQTVLEAIDIYTTLIHDPLSTTHFNQICASLFAVRSQIPVEQITKSNAPSIAECDFLFCMLLLKHFDSVLGDALQIINDVILLGGITKKKFQDFQKAVLQVIHEDNEKGNPSPSPVEDLIEKLIDHLPRNPNYSDLISEIITSSKRSHAVAHLEKKLQNPENFLPQSSRALIPKAFLINATQKLQKGCTIEELGEIGKIFLTPTLHDHADPIEYQKLIDLYYKIYFELLFSENSEFLEKLKSDYDELSKKYPPNFDQYQRKMEYQTNVVMKTTAAASAEFLAIKKPTIETFRILHTIGITEAAYLNYLASNEVNVEQLLKDQTSLKPKPHTYVNPQCSLPIFYGSIEQFPKAVTVAMMRTIEPIQVSHKAVRLFKDAFFVQLLCKNFTEFNPGFHTTFESILFSDPNQYDAFGLSLKNRILYHLMLTLLYHRFPGILDRKKIVYIVLFSFSSEKEISEILRKTFHANMDQSQADQFYHETTEIMINLNPELLRSNLEIVNRIFAYLAHFNHKNCGPRYLHCVETILDRVGLDFIKKKTNLTDYIVNILKNITETLDSVADITAFIDRIYRFLDKIYSQAIRWDESYRLKIQLLEILVKCKTLPLRNSTFKTIKGMEEKLVEELKQAPINAFQGFQALVSERNLSIYARANMCAHMIGGLLMVAPCFPQINRYDFQRMQITFWPIMFDELLKAFLDLPKTEERFLLAAKALACLVAWKKFGGFDLFTKDQQDDLDYFKIAQFILSSKISAFIPHIPELYAYESVDSNQRETIRCDLIFLFTTKKEVEISDRANHDLAQNNFLDAVQILIKLDNAVIKGMKSTLDSKLSLFPNIKVMTNTII